MPPLTGSSYASLNLPAPGTPAKGVKYPQGLDHPASGFQGVRGSVNAGAQPQQHPLQGLLSSANRQTRQATERFNAPAHPLKQLEAHAQRQTGQAWQHFQQPKPSGGSPLGTILNLPAKIEAQGYRNLASITGVPQVAKLGNLAAEAVNIPTQVFPAAFQTGKALGAARAGKPQELHELVSQFAKESPVAHLVQGDFKGAVEAAGHHPIGAALEGSAALSAVDRALAAAGRTSLKDVGASTSRAPREYPTEAVPKGGATVPQLAYHKGLVRSKVERGISAKPVPTGKVPKRLRESYDRFEGEQLRSSRADRETIQRTHHEIRKGVAGQNAIVPFGQWMADPKVLGADGQPLYRQHLREMIDHLHQAPPNELPHEQLIRETARGHLEALQNDKAFNAHPERAYQAAQKIAAEKAKLVPELNQHRVLSPETERISKLIPAFQFHFRSQEPFVDTTMRPGESPFSIRNPEIVKTERSHDALARTQAARKQREGRQALTGAEEDRLSAAAQRVQQARQTPRVNPSPDQVAKQLEAQGIHEKQLSFVSTKPHQSETAAYASGYRPGGAKQASGHLTGYNFMRGQFDPTADAALRQHLTDRAIINKARGDLRFSGEYVHSREDIAKLLEAKLHTLDPEHQASMKKYIQTELRSGSDRHFPPMKGGRSAWQQALLAHEQLQRLYPNIDLAPIRVAHPYATAEYRKGLGENLASSMDVREPDKYGPEHEFWTTRVPVEGAAQRDETAGPVGLVHGEIANRVKKYEADLGQAHLSRMPSSFWRKANVAFSIRHPLGVTQEIGMRDLAHNMGVIQGMRGTRTGGEMMKMAEQSSNPLTKLSGQRIKGLTRGTVASFAQEQARHVTKGQLEATRLAKPVDWWIKGTKQPITGAPLRAIQGGLRGFNRVTNGILTAERRAIEHPLQLPGVGKHLNQEFQRMHGKNLKVAGEFSDLERQFMAGQLDPKAVDHMANTLRSYYGDWTRASPEFKNLQRFSPFLQWYLNSARFIYHTMPVHHPIKTGLLAAIEGATRQERLAEGQEYKGGLPFGSKLLPTDLEPGQQGSIPIGNNERAGQEYYSPQGFISKGPLNTTLENVFPYASGIYMIANGINPLTKRPLEEKNAEGKKERITDANKLGLLAALSLAEGFVPPVRYATQLGKAPAGHVFRPFRTEKARLNVPVKKTSEGKGIGGKIGGSIGGAIGGKLP